MTQDSGRDPLGMFSCQTLLSNQTVEPQSAAQQKLNTLLFAFAGLYLSITSLDIGLWKLSTQPHQHEIKSTKRGVGRHFNYSLTRKRLLEKLYYYVKMALQYRSLCHRQDLKFDKFKIFILMIMHPYFLVVTRNFKTS